MLAAGPNIKLNSPLPGQWSFEVRMFGHFKEDKIHGRTETDVRELLEEGSACC